ncbi:Vacuolar_protein sorting 4b [Hexamita inflata]|uniref:Vacuolar protein sorting 4b n=1 Tax=Hexamita inflata TaxID=28002 RepID=A0AA86U0W2_9EUKA|nr:Vacuolar protein sorting 4b [Hexamita inflata]
MESTLNELITKKLNEKIKTQNELNQNSFDSEFLLNCFAFNDEFIKRVSNDLLKQFGPKNQILAEKDIKSHNSFEEPRKSNIERTNERPERNERIERNERVNEYNERTSEKQNEKTNERINEYKTNEYRVNEKVKPNKESGKDPKKQMSFTTAAQINDDKPANEQIAEIANALEKKQKEQQQQQQQQQREKEEKENKNEGDEEKQSKYVNSLLGQGCLQKHTLTLTSIHGMNTTKQALTDAILLPIQFPKLFENRQKYNRILLHSLPGCGKSFIVKCISGETKLPLITATPSQLFSKYQGQSEKLVRALFEICDQNKPCILFLDEIDSMCGQRSSDDSESSRRVKNEILQLMDTLDPQILLIGATNMPFEIDSAVRRRFEKRIFVDLPDIEARTHMLQEWILIKGEFQLSQIAEYLDGYSGADIKNVSKAINFLPVQKLQQAKIFSFINNKWVVDENGESKQLKDLVGQEIEEPNIILTEIEAVVKKIKSSVRMADIESHTKFQNEFGSE